MGLRRLAPFWTAGLLCALTLAGWLSPGHGAAPPRDEFAKEESDWRAQHVADLQKPDGWLSLIGLEWLQAGETSLGSAPDNKIHLPASAPAHVAILKLENDKVSLLAPKGGFPAGLLVAGQPAKEGDLRVDPDRDKFNSHLTIGTLNFYAIKREARYAVRIKDSRAPSLTGFQGLHWYATDPAYKVTAKWVPYAPAKSVSLVTLVGTTYSLPVPGYAEFTLQGKTFRVEPVIEDPQPTKLFFILKDTTSVSSTYPSCRFLYTPLPDHGLDQPGQLVLDFNHLENPPCAYTPYATCPLPPAGNRLPMALPVGEQRYHK
ncbi:MAG TPA: DUF1684 domain-containing protein [Dongiaceae bacterium]|nr:DUF1684 domain-containing protein [Dongiaceae bacterium]